MESTNAFIVELLNRANDDDDIIEAVIDNFQLTETQAKLKIAELLNSLQVVQNLGKKSLKIKNNPGFLTKITQDQFKQNIMIETENINNIFYLNIIPIYLDSIIRITQFPESSSIPLSTIDSLCKIKEVEDDDFQEIIAPSEKPILNNVPVGLVAQDLTFGKIAEKSKDKTINVMDFLFEDDDDEDVNEDDDEGIEVELPEEEILKGGEDSDDEGIDVDLDDEDEDEGIDVDLDSKDDEGIDVDLDSK